MRKENEFDWKAAIDENLRMGFVELLILRLLKEEDKYGYELKKEISDRTNGAITFGESSLYIPLLRMTARGMVSSRKEFVTGKRFRTYYHIEDLGRQYLAYGEEQCRMVFDGISSLFAWEGEKENEGKEQ